VKSLFHCAACGFARWLDVLLALLELLLFLPHRKSPAAHSEPFERGVQFMPLVVVSKISSKFDPKRFLSISVAVERSKPFQKNEPSLLRATHPMLFFK
jgi:hypothetical protein